MERNKKYKLMTKNTGPIYSVRTFAKNGFPEDLYIFKNWRKARKYYKKLDLEPAPGKIMDVIMELNPSSYILKQ